MAAVRTQSSRDYADLERLAESYAHTVSITKKQHHYLCVLLQHATDDIVAKINIYLESVDSNNCNVAELLELPFEEVRLSYYQVRKIINKLHNEKAATTKQIDLVKSIFTLSEIHTIFHKHLTEYEDLTHGQVQILLKSKKKFTFSMKDYPIQVHPEYELGIQETKGSDCGNIFYLKYYRFFMLDLDKPDGFVYDDRNQDFLAEVKEKLISGPKLVWALYETPRGYHAFLMSTPLAHNDHISDFLAKYYGSDHFYRLSSFKNGYRVRLSKKNDDEPYVARFVEYVSHPSVDKELEEMISPECAYFKQVHDDLLELHQNKDAAQAFNQMKDIGIVSLTSDTDGYYKSWISLINEDMKMVHPDLASPKFRKYLLSQYGETISSVKLLAPALKVGMHKPQRLLVDCTEFYIANDMLTNTIYICYQNLMMLDLDFYKDNKNEKKTHHSEELMTKRRRVLEARLTKLTQERPELTFRLYSSQGGVHAFLTSRSSNHHDDTDLELMLSQGVDFNYVVYSYLRGWSVRLNRKKKDKEGVSIYEYIGKVGTAKEDVKMVEQVRLHELLSKKYTNAEPCLMYGG